MKKVLFIVGSIRQESINRKVALAISKLLSADFTPIFAEIKNLPLYNQDFDGKEPSEVMAFKEQIKACDAVIIVTPEYNRSVPGVLKNALDIGSRPGGQSVWDGKPVGILGASEGAIGTALAQQHLRLIVSFLNMPAMSQPEAYVRYHHALLSEDGKILEAGTKAHLEKWVAAFEAWVKKFVI